MMGELENAARKNAECLQLAAENVGTLLRIAYLYESAGNYKRARRHLMAALAVSHAVSPRLILARFLLLHNRPNEALRVVRNAYDFDPGNAAVFNTLGAVRARSGQYRLAAEAFGIASDLDPHGWQG